MKTFEEYVQEGVVRKISPDIARSQALLDESEKKLKLLYKKISAMGVDDENANDYVEYCYNILLFLIRAKMFAQGYNASGKGAHEAEVGFAFTLGLTEHELEILNQLRYFRNGILYYGKSFDAEYARKIISYTKSTHAKILRKN